jgi:hypothetical protein
VLSGDTIKFDYFKKGTVLIPPGTFLVNNPVTLNADGQLSYIITGTGQGSVVTGNVNGFIFDRSMIDGSSGIRVIEKLQIQNSHSAGGAIRLNGTVNGAVRDVQIGAFTGFIQEDSSTSVTLENVQMSWSRTAGSRGFVINGNTTLISCDVVGYETGYVGCGHGNAVFGCRFEVNNTAMLLGQNDTGGADVWQGVISGCTLEANDVAIYGQNISQSLLASLYIIGTEGSPSAGSFQGLQIINATNTLFTGITSSGGFLNYAFVLPNNTDGVMFQGCIGANTGIGADPGDGIWSISVASGAQFSGCNIPAASAHTFANAPFGTGGIARDGDLWTFTDASCATVTGSDAVARPQVGATISGGGSFRVVGRYSINDGNWKVAALA